MTEQSYGRAFPNLPKKCPSASADSESLALRTNVDVAFSATVYKAETWQARLVKFAPELPFVQMLTGWNRLRRGFRRGACVLPL